MTTRCVIHDTFTIERTYPASTARVFAAFASEEAKSIWGDTGDLEAAPDSRPGDTEFDFRVGGRERFSHVWQGTTYRYDALYYDIVPDQRIVYSYEMYADDARISVSVTTIEFAKVAEGTALTYTEQGVFLDGIDGPQAGALRKEGTEGMLDGLTSYLAAREPHPEPGVS
ncbi:MAG TPA: SRPBCC domain-containing protein [Streptosporangiaceae bacterium]|nr:SRPBCC domain-containing protein [Streptosporangiaceae bacterium]